MANHGKQGRTQKQKARHYAKPSRAARHAKRWDARVEVMRADLAAREAERLAAERAAAEAAQSEQKAA